MLADRLALSLINRKQVGEQDFQYMDNGAVLLTESSRKTVLVAYQERKREELRHVFIDEKPPSACFLSFRLNCWRDIFVETLMPIRHFCGSEVRP